MPDDSSRELVAGIARVVVGVEVEKVVGGGAIGEGAIGVDEVVEGIVPMVVDILGMGDVQLVGLVEGTVVGEDCVGCLGLVECDVAGCFGVARVEGAFESKAWCVIKGGEDGIVGMSNLGDGEVEVAIEGI